MELTKRLRWIDLCKGILIICMVLGHVGNFTNKAGVDNAHLGFWWIVAMWYIPFFMQTFFVLSGYTSNFNKNCKAFFSSMVRSLVIPFVVFAILQQAFCMVVLDYDFMITVGGGKYDFITESFWFLPALFIAKTIYYFLNKYVKNLYIIGIVLILIMICGFMITLSYSEFEMPGHYNNYLHYRNGLCMAFFIWIGVWLKRLEEKPARRLLFVSTIVYLFAMSLTMLLNRLGVDTSLVTPVAYSHWVTISSIFQIIPYLFYATTGSFAVILLSQTIEKNKILEQFGKNSIVIYLIHFVVMVASVKLLSNYMLPSNKLLGYLFFIIVGCSTLLVSLLFAKIVNTKYLKWMIGK